MILFVDGGDVLTVSQELLQFVDLLHFKLFKLIFFFQAFVFNIVNLSLWTFSAISMLKNNSLTVILGFPSVNSKVLFIVVLLYYCHVLMFFYLLHYDHCHQRTSV